MLGKNRGGTLQERFCLSRRNQYGASKERHFRSYEQLTATARLSAAKAPPPLPYTPGKEYICLPKPKTVPYWHLSHHWACHPAHVFPTAGTIRRRAYKAYDLHWFPVYDLDFCINRFRSFNGKVLYSLDRRVYVFVDDTTEDDLDEAMDTFEGMEYGTIRLGKEDRYDLVEIKSVFAGKVKRTK